MNKVLVGRPVKTMPFQAMSQLHSMPGIMMARLRRVAIMLPLEIY